MFTIWEIGMLIVMALVFGFVTSYLGTKIYVLHYDGKFRDVFYDTHHVATSDLYYVRVPSGERLPFLVKLVAPLHTDNFLLAQTVRNRYCVRHAKTILAQIERHATERFEREAGRKQEMKEFNARNLADAKAAKKEKQEARIAHQAQIEAAR